MQHLLFDIKVKTKTSRQMGAKEERARLRANKHKSPEDWLKYICKCSNTKAHGGWNQRSRPEFILHCIDLYHKQNGLCAISGVKMTYSQLKYQKTQISIDRIDNSIGYQVGNIRLVCLWINYALGDSGLQNMLFFVRNMSNRLEELESMCREEEKIINCKATI